MDEYIKINDVFTDWSSNGIFNILNSIGYNFPWANNSNITPARLDMLYHGMHSGNKNISNFVYALLEEDNTITTINKQNLAWAIVNMFDSNWNSLYKTLTLEYNPIENYNMEENVINSETNTGTVTNNNTVQHGESVNNTHTGTQTLANGKVITDSNNVTVTGSDTVSGFDSATLVDSTANTNNTSVDDVTQYGGNDITQNDLTDTETHSGTDTNNTTQTNDLSHNVTNSLNRSGNIGVTTSQQMIEQERKLWDWHFFDVVFSDIDKILTLNIY